MVKRLSYLGPAGTYSEAAAVLYDSGAELVPFPTIPAVCRAVSDGIVDECIVPIENSIEGSVVYTLDFLISETDLSIFHEVVLPIQHCLMVRPGSGTEDFKVVFSHPQSLAQCRRYLEEQFPSAEPVASLSNSAAVTDMLESKVTAAAIAPQRAAELYGAEVIRSGIQDVTNNVTRFVLLGCKDHSPTGNDKTSFCFTFTKDAPGSLYNALGVFASRNINLAKIESRPTKESLGQYNFLVDCEGHRENELVREALEALSAQVSGLKVFGSYPCWNPGT
ncbi:Bifunctional chorismate mutase/prephenate dehydratase [Geodia barretti]|uniref:prephenate dehydratase n=1 Tax=Geodia barretti TaxID=519541 RepID=A0AA35T0P4_GEOBA|nr:Bifunctional chorismate mutase/prephenate dehydratase [Geodia barretti]